MTIGLIGTKLGMTREFIESGQSIPVTVIKIEKGRVKDVIEKEKRGYRLPGLFRARQLFETYFGCKIDWMQITDTEIKLEIEAERIAESEQEIMLDAYHESLDET